MICGRSDFFSILPLNEQCEVTPYKRGRGGGVAFTLYFSTNFRSPVYFDTRRFLIGPHSSGRESDPLRPILRSVCGERRSLLLSLCKLSFPPFAGTFEILLVAILSI